MWVGIITGKFANVSYILFCFRLQKIFDFIKRDFIPFSVMKKNTVCYFDRVILNFQLHIQIKVESQL